MAEEMKNNEVEETKEVNEQEHEEETPSVRELMVQIKKLEREKNKASSEAAEYKKKFRATQSAQEVEKAEREEFLEKQKEETEQMRRQLNILTLEKSYMGMGFTEDEASRMAVAETDNDLETKMKIMTEVDARKKKDFEAEFIKNRPEINSGFGGKTITQEEFDKMSLYDLTKLRRENPETYDRLMGLK